MSRKLRVETTPVEVSWNFQRLSPSEECSCAKPKRFSLCLLSKLGQCCFALVSVSRRGIVTSLYSRDPQTIFEKITQISQFTKEAL